ncbi:MAG: hypothetical protein A3C36_05195 [Omnitrophica WOR_2 bacterium RIFCSPHIGHO2_02_FULL_52_10]|nr:MAG: hypothetical protein A3C36_05195 [Omnitrophica WOR_2 bacterium RIFCSPHIGHO2_02_FULL_52_10]
MTPAYLLSASRILEKRLFLAGLILSFLTHVVLISLFALLGYGRGLPRKSLKTIEIIYQDIKQLKAQAKPVAARDVKLVKDVKTEENEKVKVLTRKENIFSSFGERIRDITKLSGNLLMNRDKDTNIRTLDIGKKITLSPLSTEKINNPQYLTYNDDMRSAISRNIKERAYTYVNHPDFQAGEVYVTFVLESSGILKKVKIIEEKTAANSYLRNVALRSIMESNPFPPFPKGFDYPEFTFNLLITFQD